MRFAFGETWTVLRATDGGLDRNGNPLPGVDAEIPVEGCAFIPGNSLELTEPGRTTVTTNPRLLMPTGSDVRASDRLRSPAGEVFEVEGAPSNWRSPFSGWAPGAEVELKAVDR